MNNKGRARHAATLLNSGKVLVATGFGPGGVSSSAELYDPATDTWSLPDGRVLVAGGVGPSGGLLSSTELYDPATGTWSPTGSLSQVRGLHTATLLPDGRVLVAGGYDGSTKRSRLSSAELYDPATGTWSQTGNMSQGRSLHGRRAAAQRQGADRGGIRRNRRARLSRTVQSGHK